MQPAGPAPPRYAMLDGLRGLAALAIVMHHFTASSAYRELFPSAAVAVEFFFCASGFVAGAAHHDKLVAGMPILAYARRRLARIYPMYAVGLALGLAVVLLLKARGLTDLGGGDIAAALALNAFVLPFPDHGWIQVFGTRLDGMVFPFNGPAWTLFFLLLANAAYAATARSWRGAPWRWLALFAAALALAAAAYGEAPGWSTDNFAGGLPRVLFAFFSGIAVYQLHRRVSWRFSPALVIALVVALLAAPHFPGHVFYWYGVVILAVPVVVLMAARSPVEPRGALRRLSLYSGRISYAMYCIHYPLLMALPLVVPQGAAATSVLGLYLLATIALSDVLARYVEGPLRARLTPRPVAA